MRIFLVTLGFSVPSEVGFNQPSLTHLSLVPHISVSDLGQHWFEVMDCRLLRAKPLPEPMLIYCQLDA